MVLCDFVVVGIKDPIECAVVFGTPQGKHPVGLLYIPPGPRALEAHMTDELVGRLNPSTPDGISSLTGKPIVNTSLIVFQVSAQLPDLLGRFGILGLHPLQSPDYFPNFPTEEASKRGFYPLCLLCWMVSVLKGSYFMEMLTAMIVIQDLHSRGKERFHLLPDPLSTIGNHTQADFLLRDQACFFDLLQRIRQSLIALHLMPTEQMLDPVSIHQIEAKAFGFSPLAFPSSTLGALPLATPSPPFGLLRTRRRHCPMYRLILEVSYCKHFY